MHDLTQQYLHDILRYDAETGNFFWKIKTNSRAPVGELAGKNSLTYGYRQIGINKKLYRAHRLVWFYFHGTWPSEQIDHINGCRSDNRIENLRVVTHQQNAWNLQKAKNNSKSGYLGVCWKKSHNKWKAEIRLNGRKTFLGYFDTALEASEAYQNAKNNRWRP
jgi:hypothetical protein